MKIQLTKNKYTGAFTSSNGLVFCISEFCRIFGMSEAVNFLEVKLSKRKFPKSIQITALEIPEFGIPIYSVKERKTQILHETNRNLRRMLKADEKSQFVFYIRFDKISE